jgi:hypothetical protein
MQVADVGAMQGKARPQPRVAKETEEDCRLRRQIRINQAIPASVSALGEQFAAADDRVQIGRGGCHPEISWSGRHPGAQTRFFVAQRWLQAVHGTIAPAEL